MSGKIIKLLRIIFILVIAGFISEGKIAESKPQSEFAEKDVTQSKLPNKLFGLTIDETTVEDFSIEDIIQQLNHYKDSSNHLATVRIVLPVYNNTNKLGGKYRKLIKEISIKKAASVDPNLVDFSSIFLSY